MREKLPLLQKKRTKVDQDKSTHSFQARNMSDIDIFWNSESEVAQDANMVRLRLATTPLDSVVPLNNLLLRSHHRLQRVANKESCNKEEHLGETEVMSLAKDNSATEDGMTQATPNWATTELHTIEEEQ